MREVRYGSRSAHLEFDNRVIAYPIKEHIIGQNALGLWMVVVRSVQVCRLGRIDRPSSDIRYHPFIISDRFRADRLRERSGMPVKRMTRAAERGKARRALLIDFLVIFARPLKWRRACLVCRVLPHSRELADSPMPSLAQPMLTGSPSAQLASLPLCLPPPPRSRYLPTTHSPCYHLPPQPTQVDGRDPRSSWKGLQRTYWTLPFSSSKLLSRLQHSTTFQQKVR